MNILNIKNNYNLPYYFTFNNYKHSRNFNNVDIETKINDKLEETKKENSYSEIIYDENNNSNVINNLKIENKSGKNFMSNFYNRENVKYNNYFNDKRVEEGKDYLNIKFENIKNKNQSNYKTNSYTNFHKNNL